MEELTKDNFDEKVAKGNSIIDFWAPWCGPCKVLGPNFEAASKESEGVNFFKLNVDDEPEVAVKYGVRSIPTLVMFKDGDKVDSVVGAMSKEQVLDKVKEVFGN